MSRAWTYSFEMSKQKGNTLSERAVVKEDFQDKENEVKSEPELEETQEEVVEEVDEGELLVLRRVISNRRGVTDEQIENIFYTHCTV